MKAQRVSLLMGGCLCVCLCVYVCERERVCVYVFEADRLLKGVRNDLSV